MTRLALFLLAGALALFAARPAVAQVPMTGAFVAEARCPAFQSIRLETNPGTVSVEPGVSYALLGRNAEPGTHYLLLVPGAEPERRWVAFGCGRIEEAASRAADGADEQAPPANRSPFPTPGRASAGEPGERLDGDLVLAASWQVAFCETRPRVAECRGAGPPVGFTLHGLWPEGEYCEGDALGTDWDDLPEPELSAATRARLAQTMPGVASNLHRHEWAKHGTCSGLSADAYFRESIRLVEALNASAVGELFTGSIGYALDAGEVRAAFDDAFGTDAGARVMLDCARDGERTMIAELRINLRYGDEAGLGALLGRLAAEAPPAPRGCPGGAVDAAGAQ